MDCLYFLNLSFSFLASEYDTISRSKASGNSTQFEGDGRGDRLDDYPPLKPSFANVGVTRRPPVQGTDVSEGGHKGPQWFGKLRVGIAALVDRFCQYPFSSTGKHKNSIAGL